MRLWLIALVTVVLTNTTWTIRSVEREFAKDVHAVDRFIDIGVRLHVVRAVPDDAKPTRPAPGRPDLDLVRTHELGGILDTKLAQPAIVRPTETPVDWYCSEDQEAVILHPDSEPLGQLVYGSMGAGKTTCGVIWLYARWLETIYYGRSGWEGGITAPTETRLSLVFNEILRMFPPAWRSFSSSENIVTLADGTRLRGVSTYRQSAAQGTRIAGFTWGFGVLSDEAQDQCEEIVHIDARCRGGRVIVENGRKINCVKQLRTATAKDDPNWRTLRDQLDAARDINGKRLWIRRTLYGRRSPFLPASHWEALKATMSERDYARNVEAKDVPPETATYPEWSRQTNLVLVSDIGWIDVTANELRVAGGNYHLLVGHDPGTSIDVSLFLKAYVPPGKSERDYLLGKVRPWWVVLGELNTEATTEVHIIKLLEHVRETWQLNLLDRNGRMPKGGDQMLVHADPAGNSDNRTDKSVYTQFTNAGIRIRPAAYNATHDGHGKVPREAGVELVNTLICNARQERRLFVAKKPDGSPAAPKLVAALENSERDLAGRAEVAKNKGARNDQTHWPAALRYALWSIERPRLQLVTREVPT